MKVLVSFSGGKDSLASLIWACNQFGNKNVEAVFCDTKWEHTLTYAHIDDVVRKLGITLTVITSKKYDGFVDLAVKKKRFPSTKARFCTEELKVKPMIDYLLDDVQDNLLIIQGIRKDESKPRSKMDAQCRFFRYYFEPYQTNSMIVEAYKHIKNPSAKQIKKYLKAKERIFFGKEDAKFLTYRKKEVFDYCKQYADDLLRPVFDWTALKVIRYILKNGLKPNPLYYLGFSRVGCMPCIMAIKQEVKSMIKNLPDAVERLKNAENEVGSNFFPPGYIPDCFCTGISNGKKFPTLDDVVKYISRGEGQFELFKDKNTDNRCMSFYGLCE